MNPNPPTEHLTSYMWKQGQSGNPGGIQSLGRALGDQLNRLGTMCRNGNLKKSGLKKIAKDEDEDPTRVIAAIQLLRAMENGDMADFEALLDGKKSLLELRGEGISTEIVKRVKTKTRTITPPEGNPIVEVEREVELHDRTGASFDRVSDRTEGKPNQTVNVNALMPPMMVVFGYEPAPKALPEIIDEASPSP